MKSFIFNHDLPNTAISFHLPVLNDISNTKLITLQGQKSVEVTGLQSIHYQEILNNHSELEEVDEQFLEVIAINNDKELTDTAKELLLQDNVLTLTDEQLLETDLDKLGLTDEQKKELQDRLDNYLANKELSDIEKNGINIDDLKTQEVKQEVKTTKTTKVPKKEGNK